MLNNFVTASGSAVKYATVIEITIRRASGRDARPAMSSKPPKHSSEPIKYAFRVGSGIPRLAKNSETFPMWDNLPWPV